MKIPLTFSWCWKRKYNILLLEEFFTSYMTILVEPFYPYHADMKSGRHVYCWKTYCLLVTRHIISVIEPIREDVNKIISCATLWCNIFKELPWLGKQVNISWYEPIRNGIRRPVVLSGLSLFLKRHLTIQSMEPPSWQSWFFDTNLTLNWISTSIFQNFLMLFQHPIKHVVISMLNVEILTSNRCRNEILSSLNTFSMLFQCWNCPLGSSSFSLVPCPKWMLLIMAFHKTQSQGGMKHLWLTHVKIYCNVFLIYYKLSLTVSLCFHSIDIKK